VNAFEKLKGNYELVPWSGCWIWMGALNDKGYGRFRSSNGKLYAHRVAYDKFVAPIPHGMDVLHRCDVACCVNPAHLFLGTQADNNADRDRKGRHVALRGEKNGMSKLTPQLIGVIRASRESSVALSKRIDINASTIRKIRRGELWRTV
jgi:hypothetical protein